MDQITSQLLLEAIDTEEVIDVDGDVYEDMLEDFVKDGRLTIKFGKVTGYFNCSDLGLTTLEGCPETVGKSFHCSGNEIANLIGGPKTVGWIFVCEHNRLTSLDGCPEEIGDDFYCRRNPSLVRPKVKPPGIKGRLFFK